MGAGMAKPARECKFTVQSETKMGDSPPVALFGIQVLEPVTSLTDIMVALVCFFAFFRLGQLPATGRMYQYFRLYFLLTGIATTSAGLIGHAFLYLFSFEWKMIGWAFSATGILMMEWATLLFVRATLAGPVYRGLWVLTALKYLAFWVFMLTTRNFLVTQIFAASGLVVVVLFLQIAHYRKTGHPGSRRVILALLFSLLPALAYNYKLTLHVYFNHHDISHLLMAVFVFLMYRGVDKIVQSHLELPDPVLP
jgi:hypothetical protein